MVDRLVQQSAYLQSVMAGHAKKNARRARWGLDPVMPTQVEFENAAFVERELAASVPKIDVEKWWRDQTHARREQSTAGKSSTPRDVREREIGVLNASHLANRSEICASLCKLMPFMSSVILQSSQSAEPEVPAINEEGVPV
jgi:hypothetical protein